MTTTTYPPSPAASATPPRNSPFGADLKVPNGTQSPEPFSHDALPTLREHLEATYNRRTIPLMPEEAFFELCDHVARECASTTSHAFHAALAERVRQRTASIERQLHQSKLAMLDPDAAHHDDALFMLIQQETSLGRSQFIVQTLRDRAAAASAPATTPWAKNRVGKPTPRNRRRAQPLASTTESRRRSVRIREMKKTIAPS
ncbi:hypothetical protein ACEQ8H_008399 [Pleosporales sp. CAS-2024a]